MNFAWGILLGLTTGIGAHFWISRNSRQTSMRMLERLSSTVGIERVTSDPAHFSSQMVKYLRQQQQDRQALIAQIQDWETLAHELPWGFLQVDEHNVVVVCNPAAQQLLQIEHWQPGVKVLLEWVRSYELDQLVEQMRHQAHQSTDPCTPQMREWQFYPSGGEAKPIPVRGWAVPLQDGQIGLFLEDRVEAKTLEQQRDRWASDVAHELKTPLTSIRLIAETLQNRVDPSMRTWIDRLLNETIRLSSLVQDLLELSSLNLGASAALQMRPVDLVPLLWDAWQSLEPQARLREQTLDYQGPAEADLWGDESRLYRLFLNLFDNSIKYGKVGTPVHVGIQLQGARIAVEVYDHGSGLPEQTFDSVFEPFYRTDSARARSDGGTGLGLAIVKQIVEAHGGGVHACNHPEAGGLWVRFFLKIQKVNP